MIHIRKDTFFYKKNNNNILKVKRKTLKTILSTAETDELLSCQMLRESRVIVPCDKSASVVHGVVSVARADARALLGQGR